MMMYLRLISWKKTLDQKHNTSFLSQEMLLEMINRITNKKSSTCCSHVLFHVHLHSQDNVSVSVKQIFPRIQISNQKIKAAETPCD